MDILRSNRDLRIRSHLLMPILMLFAFSLSGKTVTVSPGDAIADSLLTLSDGDILFLTSGIYTDASNLPLLHANPAQSGVTITSSADNRAVLDGQDSTRSIIMLRGPHTNPVVLENLVITGGNATSAETFKGGGVFASESNVLIGNCLFLENRALFGGGIGTEGGSLEIVHSILMENEALATGGGIDLYTTEFKGFMLEILSNTCSDDGGGIHAYQSTSNISNSLFTGNYAGDDGGALTILQGTVELDFLTIDSNEAFDDGGGIRIHTVDSFSILSSIVTSNLGKAGFSAKRTTDLYVGNTCCWNNEFANYFGCDDPTGTSGNISEDPVYADTDMNLSQIAAGQTTDSPAVDAGHEPAAGSVIAELSTRTDSIPDNLCADMGYHHYNSEQSSITPVRSSVNCSVRVLPSPASGIVSFHLTSEIPALAVVHLFDILGRNIHSSETVTVSSTTEYHWNPGSAFPEGLILYQVTWPWGTSSGKVAVLE